MCSSNRRFKEGNTDGSSQLTICDASRRYYDVPRFKTTLLEEEHEEGCGRVCEQVLSLSTSESSKTKEGGVVAAPKHTGVEVRKHSDGLHSRFTQNAHGLYSDLSSCR